VLKNWIENLEKIIQKEKLEFHSLKNCWVEVARYHIEGKTRFIDNSKMLLIQESAIIAYTKEAL